MISYKHFDENNFSELFKNKDYLQEIFKIKYSTDKLPRKYEEFLSAYLLSDIKKSHLFLILKEGVPVGYNKGYIKGSTYVTQDLFISNKLVNQKLGTKLNLRVFSYMRLKKNITSFDAELVFNNRIYSINESIAKRDQKTKKGRYRVEKHPELNGYYKHNGELKFKTILRFKK